VDAEKYASHIDMMKDYNDAVLITHNKEHAPASEEDIQVVSPCVVMKVVGTHYAPVPDDMDADDRDLKELLCR